MPGLRAGHFLACKVAWSKKLGRSRSAYRLRP
jgi:hypothetical protein